MKENLTYSEWLARIYAATETRLNVTRSDAQSIVDAQSFKLAQYWALDATPEDTAAAIALVSQAKPPSPKPTAGAWRAANLIENGIGGSLAGYRPPTREEIAATIDRETGAADLLAALKRAREWMDNCGAQGGAQAALDDADAAITNAEKANVKR